MVADARQKFAGQGKAKGKGKKATAADEDDAEPFSLLHKVSPLAPLPSKKWGLQCPSSGAKQIEALLGGCMKDALPAQLARAAQHCTATVILSWADSLSVKACTNVLHCNELCWA